MDEAGRGPAIGPIVFGLVVLTKDQENKLNQFGVQDSKNLTDAKRQELVKIIETNSEFYNAKIVTAKEIDMLRASGKTLNQIEVDKFRELFQTYENKLDILQLDAADVNANRFGEQFEDLTNAKIISEHKADGKYVAVSAASIIAKVKRDGEIFKLQQKLSLSDPELPSFGSGYPTDAKPFLKEYVRKYQKLPEIARHSWKTCSKILDEVIGPKQSSLDDFLS